MELSLSQVSLGLLGGSNLFKNTDLENIRVLRNIFLSLEIRRFGGGLSISNKSWARVKKYLLALTFRSQYRQHPQRTETLTKSFLEGT